MMGKFNYEKKVWGQTPIASSPFYIQGLKLKYTLDELKNIKGNILDIGCGGGNMAKAIKHYRPDLNVFGVDISRHAIEEAKKNTHDVDFKVSRGEKLPHKDKKFDAVVIYDVLEHLRQPEIALREAKRVLKESGVLHIFSPLDGQPFTIPWAFYSLGWRVKDKHTGHVQLFSDKSFAKLLENNGFKIRKRAFSFHPFFQIFDVLYFSILDMFNLKIESSIEGMISKKKSSPLYVVFGLFYKFVVMIGHYESTLLRKLSGAGGHYTAVPIDIKHS